MQAITSGRIGSHLEPATNVGEQPLALRQIGGLEDAFCNRAPQPAAEPIRESTRQGGAGGRDRAADKGTIDDAECGHNGGRRNRQEQIRDEQKQARGPGPAAVIRQPGYRARHGEQALYALAPKQERQQHEQHERDEDPEQTEHELAPSR